MSESSDFSAWFWNPEIWLPPNVTWESFQETPHPHDPDIKLPLNHDDNAGGEFAQFHDLWYPVPMAIAMMLVRYLVEKYIFTPIGLRVGMKQSKRSYPRSNTILETEFRKNNFPSQQTFARLSSETSLSQIDVRHSLHCIILSLY